MKQKEKGMTKAEFSEIQHGRLLRQESVYNLITPSGFQVAYYCNWRTMLQAIERIYGVRFPVSVCRKLWHGAHKLNFKGYEIEEI